jgi:hypothetical protein
MSPNARLIVIAKNVYRLIKNFMPKKLANRATSVSQKGGVQMKEEKDLQLVYSKIMPKLDNSCKL